MIKTITLSLFTLYNLSHGQIQGQPQTQSQPAAQQYGAFGQLCPVPTAPDQVTCTNTFDIATPGTVDPGLLDCGRVNDCCLCAKLECGTITNPCHTVAIGANGAFGVKAINVLGDATAGGANFECMGSTACSHTLVNAQAISELSCAAPYACYQSVMKVTEPAVGFGIECAGEGACAGLQIELYIPPPTTGTCDPLVVNDILWGGMECMGEGSCQNLLFIINNQGCDNIIMEAIHCPVGACDSASFQFFGKIDIDFCELPASGPQPTGLDKCFSNLRELACAGKECQNQRRAISVVNNFELMCEGAEACLNAQYAIGIIDLPVPVTNIRIGCIAENACQNAVFMVDNFARHIVTVSVECIGNGACDGTMFIGGSNAVFEAICDNPMFCSGCMLNGSPCNPNANIQNPQVPNGPQVV